MILLAVLLLAGSTIEEAEHALAAGRFQQAEQMVRQIVASGGTGDRVDRLRAGSAASMGRHEEALALYSRALLYEDRGDKPKAIEYYQKALEVFPNYTEAREGLRKARGS